MVQSQVLTETWFEPSTCPLWCACKVIILPAPPVQCLHCWSVSCGSMVSQQHLLDQGTDEVICCQLQESKFIKKSIRQSLITNDWENKVTSHITHCLIPPTAFPWLLEGLASLQLGHTVCVRRIIAVKQITEVSPAVLHCEMQAIMNPTKPCSNATDRTHSRLSVCNTNNIQSVTETLS